MKPATRESVDKLVMMHVFIHGHHETGKPVEINVFEVEGRMHMDWFAGAMEPEDADSRQELAEAFYEHVGDVNVGAWFLVGMESDSYDEGGCFHYPEVITRLTVKS